MIRKILLTTACLFSITSFAATPTPLACGQAVPTTNASFCASFAAVAKCNCSQKIPPSMCQDMNMVYARMIDMFKSLDRACAFQHDTSKQNCIDDWNCYRSGGRNSAGGLCSSTGNACQ